MATLVLSILCKSRPACQKVVGLSASCLTRRLESFEKTVTFVYRTTANSAKPSVAFKELDTQDESYESLGLTRHGREKRYYHNILESSPLHKETIFTEQDLQLGFLEAPSDISPLVAKSNWSEVPAQEMLQAFHNMAAYAIHNDLDVTDSMFEPICEAITSRLNEFSEDELLEIGKCVLVFERRTNSSLQVFRKVAYGLNDYWIVKYPKWVKSRDLVNILKAADMTYWMNVQHSTYIRCMVYHMAMKVREPHYMLQLMFYLGMVKRLPNSYKVYELEKKMFSLRKSYSITDLHLFVNAIFNTKSQLQYQPLQQHFLLQAIKQFPSLDDYMLITVSKGFNSASSGLKPLIELFQQKVVSKVNDFKMETIVHVLWMSVSNNVFGKELFQAVYDRAIKEIDTIRWKELSRMMIMFAEFPPPGRDVKYFGECVIKEMIGREDVKEWIGLKVFIQGAVLHRLLLSGVCHRDIFDNYLDWVNSAATASICKQALSIDVHLEVFYPAYDGTRLCPKLRKEICQQRFLDKSGKFQDSDGSKRQRSSFNLEDAKRMRSDILSLVGSVEDHIDLRMSVPSFGYFDYLLCLSEDGTYLPIPREVKECEPWELPYIPSKYLKDGKKFIAITFFHHHAEFVTRKIVALQKEKTKILEKLGYVHIDVPLANWQRASPELKQQTLKNIIANKLSESQAA